MRVSEKTVSAAMQTRESVREDFDRIAGLSSFEGWSHNSEYHAYLLARVGERCGRALEIGCGTGEFTRRLAGRAERVLAVDLSPRMIEAARERSAGCENVEFVLGDVMELPLAEGAFDCVTTLTTLHHLPMEEALKKIRRALKPGGVFVCLDLYRRSSFGEVLLDGVALPAGLLLRLLRTGRPRPPKAVREAYAEHGKTDTYLTLPEIRRVCAEVMPGASVRRHLLWRYSIVWRKERASQLVGD